MTGGPLPRERLALSRLALAQATQASLVDLTSNTVLTSFTVGNGPTAVVWASATVAYVVNDEDNTLVRLDMTTSPPSVNATFTFAAGFEPHGLAINPAGTRALVTGDTTSVFLLDLTTTPFTVIDTITVTLDAAGVAFYAAGTKGIIVNEPNLLFLDLTVTPAGVTTVSMAPNQGLAIAVNPLGTRAVVTVDAGGLRVVDLTTSPPSLVGGLVGPVGPGSDPLGVAISPDGTRAIYVDEENPPEANVIDVTTPGLVNSVPISLLSPSAVAFNPLTSAALVAADDGVAVLNPPYTAVNATILHPNRRGATAFSIAVNPAGTRAIVLHEDPFFCLYPIDFGNVLVGTTSAPITETCTNTGVGPVTITSVSIFGTGFALTGVPAVPQSLPSGGTFSFGITFTPPVVGPQSGSVSVGETVESTGTIITSSVGLSGTGVAAVTPTATPTPGGPAPTPTPTQTAIPAPGPSAIVPTLSPWMLGLLCLLLAAVGYVVARRNG